VAATGSGCGPRTTPASWPRSSCRDRAPAAWNGLPGPTGRRGPRGRA
jgi:hypothetical protein